MKRSYSIKIYGKTVKTVGGEKAGRFYSNGIMSQDTNKNALETVTKRNKRISKVFRPINKKRTVNKMKNTYNIALNRFKICFCLILLAGAIHSGYVELHKTVENTEASEASNVPDEVPSMVLTSFESMDIPADYREPDLYDKYFKSEARLARAICIAENRSQDPNAINYANKDGSFDTGLCQINSIHIGKVSNLELLKDPETNIRVAKQIRDESGWTAWTQYKNGEYLEFY